ncbi:hypothetical protein [Nocardioides sp. KR10-350]|uniref:hypothetical protein n=1 Tax=Nocardioides cheoyonin TaxID=3156615 RepID=UPI0032B3803D
MILAHGIGGRQDLPIPLEQAILGAVLALVVSFVVLVLVTRWHEAEAVESVAEADAPAGVPAPRQWRPSWVTALGRVVDSTAWAVALRTVGMLFFAYAVLVACFGRDIANNPLFGIFYVWWWIGLVPFSVLFGPAWKAISPVRTINAAFTALRGGSGEPLYRYPERLGYWPAAVGLLAFAWMELVYPNNNYLGPVRLWCAIYVAVMLVGGQLFGTRFYERCDPFEVYSSLVAKLSVWARDDIGRLVVRTPLGNLDTLRPAAGLVTVVCVLFGTIVFDSFRDSTPWLELKQGEFITAHRLGYPLDNVALIGFPLAVAIFYCAGTMLTGVGHVDRRHLPAHLAPSIVPIVVGYVVAHYLSYYWEAGQATLRQASDPLSNGGNWFGTSGLQVNYFFAYHATLLADLKVLSVVVGHVLGVWSAHIRALEVLPRKHLVTGQIPLLVTMIGFTIGGLYLLFAS